jgi:hypothetical protein
MPHNYISVQCKTFQTQGISSAHDLGPAHVPKVSLVEMNADKLIESAVNRGREWGERERLNGKTKFLT